MHSDTLSNQIEPAKPARMVVDGIDKLSSFFGKTIAILIIPMVFCLVYEVVARYLFNAPTVWAMDMATIFYGFHFMIASPYCLRDGVHIRTDFLYNRWSDRTQGIVDLIIFVIVYLPVHLLFLKVGWEYFLTSYHRGERLIASPWMPIIWPLKFAIPLAIFLMVLQGISETIKSFYAIKYGKWLWERNRHAREAAVVPETKASGSCQTKLG